MKNREYLESEFTDIIKDLVNNPLVCKMYNFYQHYDTTCFAHCYEVSFYSYFLCKKLGLDYISAARGGMLHDLFLYNWRHSRKTIPLDGYHAFVHPKIALKNAKQEFKLNQKEEDIILKHMWPLTLFSFPKYKESYIITLVDKYCAIKECFDYYSRTLQSKKIYRYSYILLTMFFFKIV